MNITQIPVDQIKVFVHRDRLRPKFEEVKASIAQYGLTKPIQVRDISNWPKEQRKHYKYELISGEGRLLAHIELGLPKINAFIKEAKEGEIVGMFLAENLLRKKLPWIERARLMQTDMKAGLSNEEIAERYNVTPKHVLRCVKVLQLVSANTLSNKKLLEELSVEEAELLTSLPATGQDVVVAALTEGGFSKDNIPALVKQARRVAEEGTELSVRALKESLDGVKSQLQRQRDKLKLKRLHWSLGPQNLSQLLENKKFRSEAEAAGISFTHFLNVSDK